MRLRCFIATTKDENNNTIEFFVLVPPSKNSNDVLSASKKYLQDVKHTEIKIGQLKYSETENYSPKHIHKIKEDGYCVIQPVDTTPPTK